MISTQTMNIFLASLYSLAKKDGVDLTGLMYEPVCLENTWGQKEGYIFWGLTRELNQRVADYFNSWIPYHDDNPGGYGNQRSYGTVMTMHYMRFANGAEDWYRGACPHGGKLMCAVFNADGPDLVEAREGVAVSTTYCPDFD